MWTAAAIPPKFRAVRKILNVQWCNSSRRDNMKKALELKSVEEVAIVQSFKTIQILLCLRLFSEIPIGKKN